MEDSIKRRGYFIIPTIDAGTFYLYRDKTKKNIETQEYEYDSYDYYIEFFTGISIALYNNLINNLTQPRALENIIYNDKELKVYNEIVVTRNDESFVNMHLKIYKSQPFLENGEKKYREIIPHDVDFLVNVIKYNSKENEMLDKDCYGQVSIHDFAEAIREIINKHGSADKVKKFMFDRINNRAIELYKIEEAEKKEKEKILKFDNDAYDYISRIQKEIESR